MEILGPAWKVELFVGDAPCLAGLGQAGLLDVMRDVVTKVGFCPVPTPCTCWRQGQRGGGRRVGCLDGPERQGHGSLATD